MGGNMDGMGDLDNAPMPPMGSDDMGMMDGQNGMGEEPMGGEEPTDMGGDQPMGSGDDDELMSVINNLSMEDKAAVLKYAKSMEDNGGEEIPQDNGGMMPMESRKSIRNIIDETINDVLNDNGEGTERPKKELPKEYRGMKNPFKSPY